MKYTKKDLGSYNLHLINTDKLKTITIRVVFHTPIKKEEITKRTLISDILLQSSKKYNSRRDMIIESEELYDVDIAANNQRLGNYIFTSFNLQVLMDKYTEEGNLEKAIEFLSEIILNPDVKDNKFDKEMLELVKHNSKVTLNSIKEKSTSYSMIRMAESFAKDSPISYRIVGYLDDLEDINTENLYNCYYKMIDNDYVDIFVVGDFNNKEMLSTIKKYFKFKKIKKSKEPYILDYIKPRKRKLIAKETIDNTQSKLAIAAPISKLTQYERNYSLIIADLILGGGVDSKLFKEVREENSLCYTIRSFVNRLDNLMIINAGIDKNNYSKTVKLIGEKLEDMKKGRFTTKDIEVAKEYYFSSLEDIDENENKMINEVISEELLGIEPIKDRIEIMNKIRKQDIVRVCKKINIDTIFLLEGVKHEED